MLSTPSTLLSVAGLVERLEPLNGISMGKEIEANLIMLSEKKITDLDRIECSSCIIIGVELAGQSISLEESFQELGTLMAYGGLSIVGSESQKSAGINDDNIFGNGKIKEIASQLISTSSHTVIFDGELSSIQLKNLEDSILNELPSGMKRVNVLDKTAIILDIIAQNSRSAESAMQAELAILMYRLPRMTRMWTQFAKPVEDHLCLGCRGPGNIR
jgi:GTP-binding protein HflX